MKFEWKDKSIVIIPETNPEKDSFSKVFKAGPTGTRRIKVREFVDPYGKGTGGYYLEVVGKSVPVAEAK